MPRTVSVYVCELDCAVVVDERHPDSTASTCSNVIRDRMSVDGSACEGELETIIAKGTRAIMATASDPAMAV